ANPYNQQPPLRQGRGLAAFLAPAECASTPGTHTHTGAITRPRQPGVDPFSWPSSSQFTHNHSILIIPTGYCRNYTTSEL
ncbi:hypothetical protein, partial [Pontibacter qinzhouensis]|uniref:hypothetical protein n=1 Tax=Pontibacter qinzhouensis TaxID=2603253 RepID=UPI001C9C782A